MAVETRYFCNGTCGAVIAQEQFDGGLTKCGTKDCSLENHEFEKGIFCTTCEKRIKEGEEGDHKN